MATLLPTRPEWQETIIRGSEGAEYDQTVAKPVAPAPIFHFPSSIVHLPLPPYDPSPKSPQD
ncbi:MAG: hypothetical protein ACXWDN_11575 [Limisphaerales bacterium]